MCVVVRYHQYPSFDNVADFVCVHFILLSVGVEVGVQWQGEYWRYFENLSNGTFLAVLLLHTVGSYIGMCVDTASAIYWLSGLRFFGIIRFLIVAAFFRERFHFLTSKVSSTLTQTVLQMIPVFLRIIFYFMVGIMYFFIIIGIELFYDWHDASQWGQDRCDGAKQLHSDPYALFCDFNAAFITLFQILTTNVELLGIESIEHSV